MNSTAFLGRLLFARHRWFLLTMVPMLIVTALLGHTSLSLAPQTTLSDVCVQLFCLTMIVAFCGGAILLDFCPQGDVGGLSGMFEPWLLRTPLSTWRLALVPIIAKTVWILTLWLLLLALFVHSAVNVRLDLVSILAPPITLSAISVGLSAILWRPYASSLRRMALLMLYAVVCYGLLFAVLTACFEQQRFHWFVRTGTLVGCVLLWMLLVRAAVAQLEQSRSHSLGRIAASPRPDLQSWWWTLDRQPRPWATGDCSGALRWHDAARARRDVTRSLCWIAAPVLFLVCWQWPMIGMLAFLVPCMVLWTLFNACAAIYEPRGFSDRSPLPEYLISLPLSQFDLFRSRLSVTVRTAVTWSAALMTGIAIATWLGGHHETMFRLWRLGDTGWIKPTWMGVGATPKLISLWVVLWASLLTLGLGRVIAFQWIVSSEHARWLVYGCLTVILSVIVGTIAWILWQISNRPWDQIREDVVAATQYLPWIIGTLLTAKGILAIAESHRLTRNDWIKPRQLCFIWASWAAFIATIAIILWLLKPYTPLGFAAVLSGTALTMPLWRLLRIIGGIRSSLHH
ncbi:hypothetical protein [Crateriforma conspicua]|uniref:Uncharacterized protein n=1 Tax=Crateriforma conspicua TaxID=2527996 RepID=A0A5C5Y403_9PLAN|nr:hypothetical protein [Crateriforma conspicua]TWT69678.1 hypothetical protein Pan14r_19690 [Crateriforma conspicua]